MADKKIYDHSWTLSPQLRWERSMVGSENYLWTASTKKTPRFNIVTSIQANLRSPVSRHRLSSDLKNAWRSLFFTIPNLTFFGETSNNGSKLLYNQVTSMSEADDWLSVSFNEETYDIVEDPETVLLGRLGGISEKGIQRDLGSTSVLYISYFERDGEVKSIGVQSITEHFAMDGTGCYNCLNKLLEHCVLDKTIKNVTKKAAPEDSIYTHYDDELLSMDLKQRSQDLLRRFMLPATTLKTTREHPPQNEPAIVGLAKHTFSKQDTCQLLVDARSLNITISTLSMAAFFVTLLSVFPAKKTDWLSYLNGVNMRTMLAVQSNTTYGNFVGPIFEQVSCEHLTETVRQGSIDTVADAMSVLNLARQLHDLLQKGRSVMQEEMLAVNEVFRDLVGVYDPNAPPQAVPQNYLADGILERYVKRCHPGDHITLDIVDAYLAVQDAAPQLNARTSTFRDRLNLALSFDLRSWTAEEVGILSQRWAALLHKFISLCVAVLKSTSEHQS